MNNSYIYLFSPELGICSFAHSPSALLLKITQFKEWLWAIHSLCSLQKNDFEWFAHVALYKSVTWTNCSSCSLKKNNVSDSLVIRMNRLQKKSESLKKLTVFPLFMSKSKSFPSLFSHLLLFKERFEQFAPMAIYKRVTMSDSLRLLMTKEQQERNALFHQWIALSLTKNEQIARKTNERIPNPGSLRCLLKQNTVQ